MNDLDRLMLAAYKATVEAEQPFANAKAVFAGLELPSGSTAGMLIQQRGYLADSPVGSIALSNSGIRYVEERLLG